MIACAIGCRPPPPTPWNTRASSRNGSDGATPQRKLDTVKITMQERKKLRRPSTEDAHAPAGSTIALDTR